MSYSVELLNKQSELTKGSSKIHENCQEAKLPGTLGLLSKKLLLESQQIQWNILMEIGWQD